MKLPRLTPQQDRRRKLMPKDIEAMKIMRKGGATYQGIADKYKVSLSTVYEHLNPEKFIEKRRKQVRRNKMKYHTDPEYRKRTIKGVVKGKAYKKAVTTYYDDLKQTSLARIEARRDRTKVIAGI